MVGDFFMGDLQRLSPLQGAFLQKEGSQAFVEALPHDLLHQPHHIGEPAADELVCIIGNHSGFFHQILEQAGGKDPHFGILFCFDDHFELNIGHDAGGREQADIVVKEPVQRDLPAFAG